ncbi:hypothetical protein ACQP2Y_20950 [Actinoplanes sp. CA-051413]|uniref:hypothetical protein n=1 Tax=Actinoplanes sp. CA-051413 TaxID=3239899 RepID=UPI003D9908AF
MAGQRIGQYVRLLWPGHAELAGRTLFVPLDPDAPDFDELWQAALGELEDAVATGAQAARVLAGLHTPVADDSPTAPIEGLARAQMS